MKKTLLSLLAFGVTGAFCQLNIQSGATFFIQSGAVVTVQGDVVSQSNIQGPGKLQMKGSSAQSLNMNGNTIETVLEIDNAQNVNLTGISRLNNQLLFTTGKLQLAGFDFVMSPTATHSGADANKFVVTNGAGALKQEVTANTSFVMPVGNANYNPLNVNVAGASGFSNAFVSSRSAGDMHPQKHPRSSDFLNSYWKIVQSGITGGTIGTVGTYQDGDLTGTEPPIRSFLWNGSAWAFGTGQDNAANTVSANMTASDVELYAMNRFVLVSPKVFLQGAFDVASGLMTDRLRSTAGAQAAGTPPTGRIIPLDDPYRTAQYNTTFVHKNNSIPETVSSSVFNYKANPGDDIVDWLFIELRQFTGSSTAARVQTRSVLVQRDGDVVDIDGVSPVYFKDVDAASFVLDIRHRNHLGISSNPTNGVPLNLTSVPFDFTNTANTAILMGTPGDSYAQIGNVLKNAMFAGNVSGNGYARYQGSNGPGTANQNDRAILLSDLGGSEVSIFTDQYVRGDINMNRITRYQGSNGPGLINQNDRAWFLSQVLANNEIGIRTQALPTPAID